MGLWRSRATYILGILWTGLEKSLKSPGMYIQHLRTQQHERDHRRSEASELDWSLDLFKTALLVLLVRCIVLCLEAHFASNSEAWRNMMLDAASLSCLHAVSATRVRTNEALLPSQRIRDKFLNRTKSSLFPVRSGRQ